MEIAKGTGKKMSEAEQKAAENALKKMKIQRLDLNFSKR